MTDLLFVLLLLPNVLYLLLALAPGRIALQFASGTWIGAFFLLQAAVLFSSIGYLSTQGAESYALLRLEGLGFSLRLDTLSVILYAMVSIIAAVVLRFSLNYLRGDVRFARFLRLFFLIAGSVQLLVLAGNLFMFALFWIVTSVGLQRLLVLYPERKKAVQAAKRKFLIARTADLFLLSAFTLLYLNFGTGDLESLIEGHASQTYLYGSPGMIALLLVFAALLKSVQFPFHTWLLGVLECPTPVSAMLHAGLLNAGPFLIIRYSSLLVDAPLASNVLLVAGGISALFGTLVYLTQSSIKTGLAYSSIGHMGFSLMLCGWGLYPAALLHLVSHSFYKAHSFLNSGSIVHSVQTIHVDNYRRRGQVLRIAGAFLISILTFLVIHFSFAAHFEIPPQFLFAGTIIVAGIILLNVHALDSENNWRVNARIVLLAVLVLSIFYTLESTAGYLLRNEVPAPASIHPVQLWISLALLLAFVLAVVLQIIVTSRRHYATISVLQVHLRNGLYIETLYQRIQSSRKV